MAYDIPSISDLEAIQLLNKHYAEVITSKEGGVSSAADITQTTNPITGVTRRTLYKILDDMDVTFIARLLAMRFTPVGNFTDGYDSLTDARQTLLNTNGRYYSWAGTFPHLVAPLTNPLSDTINWIDRTEDQLLDEIRETVFQNMKRLYAEAGFNLVDGSFQMGGSLSGWPDVLWDWATGVAYQWHLDEAKTVAAGSIPTNIGTDWIDRSEDRLRDDLNIVVKTFASVSEMVADVKLVLGQIVETIGYYNGWAATTTKPKGGNRYEVVAAGTGTDDGGSFITLSNGLQAKALFPSGRISVCQFGADASITDNSQYLVNCFAYSASSGILARVENEKFDYSTSISLNTNKIRIAGDGANSELHYTGSSYAMPFADVSSIENVEMWDLIFTGTATSLGCFVLGTNTNYVGFFKHRNVHVTGFSKTNAFAYSLNSVQELDIEDPHIAYNFYGIVRSNIGYLTSTKIHGQRGYIGRNSYVGVSIIGTSSDIKIYDIVMEGNQNACIYAATYKISMLDIKGVYFEDSGNTGQGIIRVSGASGSYGRTKVKIDSCNFKTAANIATPNVYLDYAIAEISNNENIFGNGGVVTSTNTMAQFRINKIDNAADIKTLYKALLGKITYEDYDIHNQRISSDYEYGTFNAALNNITPTDNACAYQKVGKIVTVFFRFNVPSNSDTNVLQIINMPFPASSSVPAGSGGFGQGTIYQSGLSNGVGISVTSTGICWFYNGATALLNSQVSGLIRGVITYMVD